MQKLVSTIEQLGDELVRFTHALEDNYDLPEIEKELDYFVERLKECINYQPEDMTTVVDEMSDNKTLLFGLQQNCREVLAELKKITSESNVFDIIDVLKSVCVAVRRYLPTEDLDMRDFYDPDDAMEADRISRELSTPFKDEWD